MLHVGRLRCSLTSRVSNSRESAAALAMLPMSSGDHSVAEEQAAAARTRRKVDETTTVAEDFIVGAAREHTLCTRGILGKGIIRP